MDKIKPPRRVETVEMAIKDSEYERRALELYNQYHDALANAPLEAKSEVEDALKQFPDEILATYWGHGVTRGDTLDQIVALLSMIENKIYFGDAGVIRGGQPSAYTYGSFFVISRKDGRSFVESPDGLIERVRVTSDSVPRPNMGMRMYPGAFVLNGQMEPLLETLKKLYPNENIISAKELPAYIRAEEERAKNRA